ncbi:MAG TPA: hypothetical protein VFE35_08415 [Candidatus Cybelea sp.]|jgi:hypothetical protein|nr:hypothetical protein [Candidatus Cybelea sp.]
MRLLIGLIVLIAQASLTSAPGDRYFGKLKMSALRIRYETMQLRKRYETHELLPEQAEHLLILTDEAYQEWTRLYPRDPWLPSTGFALARLYQELPGTHARDRAIALFTDVKSRFPTSPYARLSRDQLHRGIATKPYPTWATAMRATPSPAASAISSPAASTTPSTAPQPSPTPS